MLNSVACWHTCKLKHVKSLLTLASSCGSSDSASSSVFAEEADSGSGSAAGSATASFFDWASALPAAEALLAAAYFLSAAAAAAAAAAAPFLPAAPLAALWGVADSSATSLELSASCVKDTPPPLLPLLCRLAGGSGGGSGVGCLRPRPLLAPDAGRAAGGSGGTCGLPLRVLPRGEAATLSSLSLSESLPDSSESSPPESWSAPPSCLRGRPRGLRPVTTTQPLAQIPRFLYFGYCLQLLTECCCVQDLQCKTRTWFAGPSLLLAGWRLWLPGAISLQKWNRYSEHMIATHLPSLKFALKPMCRALCASEQAGNSKAAANQRHFALVGIVQVGRESRTRWRQSLPL